MGKVEGMDGTTIHTSRVDTIRHGTSRVGNLDPGTPGHSLECRHGKPQGLVLDRQQLPPGFPRTSDHL
jgi:hypothetical protein